jgi:tetratricopeptide (TPR) repeat protein
LDEGLTVILGPTDQGKSAIIRALKWVLYNEPRGTDFITVGCKYCRVTLEMSNGTVIIRERDGNKNRYILRKDGQEQIFEGFGNGVPFEITRAHGIPKIHIDRDSTSAVNLAEQLEAPFLISESGSTRAKALGQLIGVHIIDAAQRNTIRDLMDAEQRKKLINEEISDINEELKNYQDLPALESRSAALKVLLNEIKQKRALLVRFTEIRQRLVPTTQGIEEACNILDKTTNVGKAETIYHKIVNNSDRISLLKVLNKKICETDNQISHMKGMLRNTEGIFAAEKISQELEEIKEKVRKYDQILKKMILIDQQMKDQSRQLGSFEHVRDTENQIENISEKNMKLVSLGNIRKNLNDVDSSIKKGEMYLKQIIQSLDSMTRQYAYLLKKLSRCPTCLNPIDDQTAQRIIVEMLES